MTIKTPPEFHQHIASLDSASSLQKHAEREVELGTGYLTTTDHGTLGITRDLYDICAPNGKFHGKLKPIIGLEAYMRDDSCPILLKNGYKQTETKDGKLTFKDTFKYAHITMHCCDEKAYFKLVKKLSDADLTAEQHGSERKPIFNWTDLEELGSENMTYGSSCFLPGTLVHTVSGLKPIESVSPGDYVYDKDGVVRSVVSPTSRFYSGKVKKLYITTVHAPVTSTPDHKFQKSVTPGVYEWVTAEGLRPGDRIRLSVEKRPNLTHAPFVFDYQGKRPSSAKTISGDLTDPLTLWVLGLFIAEGSYGTGDKLLLFSLHKKETDKAEKVRAWAEKHGAKSVSVDFKKNTQSMSVIVHGKALTAWFISLFGRCLADKKHIPEKIKDLHPDLIRYLVRGYWEGDGHIKYRKYNHIRSGLGETRRAAAATVSRSLANDLMSVFRRAGIRMNSYMRPPRISANGTKHRQCYYIQNSGDEAERFINWINGSLSSVSTHYSARIDRIEDFIYEGNVHCLNVENEPSFSLEGGVVVHNCLIGIVGRHLMQNNDVKSAIAYYERVRSLVRPGNFYAELFPHTTDTYFQSAVVVKLEDGTEVSFSTKKKLKTQHGEIYAEDLAADFKKGDRARQKHVSILDVMENRKWSGRQHLNIISVVANEGFVKNDCTPWCNHSDYQQEINKFIFSLAKKYGDKVIVSTDSHFAYPSEYPIQDIRLGNWRFGQSHHRMSGKESFEHFNAKLGVTEAMFEEWTENGFEWASKFNDFKFTPRQTLPVNFYPKDTLRHTFDLIKSHGRMDWNNPEMAARLKEEIDLLHKNGTIDLLPYFFVCEDVTNHYMKHGEIMGPARGSAGGVLLSYLLGIIQINPLKYGLSLYRFLSPDRIKSGGMPDIDNDFPHRDLLLGKDGEGGFLKERFGDHVARLSTEIALKLKSAIKDVHRFVDGFVSKEINEICSRLPDAPQGVSPKDFIFGYEIDGTEFPGIIDTDETLQNYIKAYPKHWEYVTGLLSLIKARGSHPCGFVVANAPIDTFIPAQTVSGERVTGFTAKAVEASGGLKVDFLVVNSIRDIGNAVRLIQDKHGGADWKSLRSVTDKLQLLPTETGMTPYGMCLPFNGLMLDIWNLPDDKHVFTDICSGKVETVFQLDAEEARRGLKEFPVVNGQPTLKSVKDLAVFTALDRPGPLDAYVEDENGNKHNMLVEFARRARGEKPIGAIPILDEMLRDTLGTLVFQESLQAVFQAVGGTTGIEANNFRARIGKKKINEVRKKDEPLFMKGAIPKLGEAEAQRLWGQMITFGQYGFCIDGEQRVYTDQGLMKMKDIVNNPDLNLKVLSFNEKTGLTEYVAPSARFNQGKKKVYEIELDDGTALRATEDHKFLYEDEWVELKDIIYNGDMEALICVKESPVCAEDALRAIHSKNT